MSTVADYVGRSVDLLAYDGAAPYGEAQLSQVLAQPGKSGKVTTGIQKLAQRFVIEFLTELGSLLYWPERGTRFMADARNGRLRTQMDVFASFATSMVDLRRNLRKEESTGDPDDERFGSAGLNSLTLSPGFLSLNISLVSLAGTDRQVILPIEVTV